MGESSEDERADQGGQPIGRRPAENADKRVSGGGRYGGEDMHWGHPRASGLTEG
jgi:hypothetical protein